MTLPFLCLNMIVRNESHVIRDTLRNLTDKVKIDYYVISDTGSTDDTVGIIRGFFEEKQIPGEIHHDTWKDFAHNRNLAIEHASGKSEYLLIFDADDAIDGDFPDIYKKLDKDCYMLLFGKDINCSYSRISIIKNGAPIRYVGILHEILYTEEPLSCVILQGNYNVLSGKTGARSSDPEKYFKDAVLLEQAYDSCPPKPDFLKSRYCFYIAKSYFDARMIEKAVFWFKRVLEQPFDNAQEKYLSCLLLYDCFCSMNTRENGIIFLIVSHEFDPNRVECLYHLIVYMVSHKLFQKAFHFYKLIQELVEDRLLEYKYENIIFFNEQVHFVLLPLVMIEICEKLQIKETALRMFSILFTKKFFRGLNTSIIGTILYSVRYFFSSFDEDLTRLFVEYLRSLGEVGYPLYLHSFLLDYNIKVPLFYDPYKASESGNILIATPVNDIEAWNYSFGTKNALGGSERAVNYLSHLLPKDYKIHITGKVRKETDENIEYDPEINLERQYHTVIVSRDLGIMEACHNLRFFQLYLWIHDVLMVNSTPVPMEVLLANWLPRINGIMCMTEWHKNHVLEAYPMIPKEKIYIINNGIDLDSFDLSLPVKQKNSFLYSSCPERGLKRLIGEIWPELIRRIPDATLRICSYNNFPKNQEETEMLKIIENTESIEYMGRLDTTALYAVMRSSEFWLYPTDWPETSCITAMEMLASRVICLYYPLAGLPDTLGDYGIPVCPGNEIDTILGLTEDQKSGLRERGFQYAKTCGWGARAKVWTKVLGL